MSERYSVPNRSEKSPRWYTVSHWRTVPFHIATISSSISPDAGERPSVELQNVVVAEVRVGGEVYSAYGFLLVSCGMLGSAKPSINPDPLGRSLSLGLRPFHFRRQISRVKQPYSHSGTSPVAAFLALMIASCRVLCAQGTPSLPVAVRGDWVPLHLTNSAPYLYAGSSA